MDGIAGLCPQLPGAQRRGGGCTLADGTPLNLSEKDSTGWGIWVVAKDGTKSLTTESLP